MADSLSALNAARVAFYDNRPMAYLVQTSPQTFTNGAVLGINWNVANLDIWGAWNAGSPSVYTVKVAGVYRISGVAVWDTNANGARDAIFFKNGTNVVGTQAEVQGSAASVQCVEIPDALIRCVVGDTLQVAAFQTSGITLNTHATGGFGSSMTVEWTGV